VSRSFDRQLAVVGGGLFLILVLLAWFPDISSSAARAIVSTRATGRITEMQPATADAAPLARVAILDGLEAGKVVDAQVEGPSGQLELPDYRAGDEVIVAADSDPDGNVTYSVVDRWRLPLLRILVGAFAIVTILVAGWRGIRALVALALTLVLAFKVLIPGLLAGWNPVALAIALGTLITIGTLVLTQGINRQVLAAVLGTAVGLLTTGVLAIVVTDAARFTVAQGSEQVVAIEQLTGGQIDLSGLLLAAVIFGALGVLIDVAISQSATVDELRAVDPSMARRELFGRTMNVGTSHLAASVNTLVLAYLGASLPLLVVLTLEVSTLAVSINEEIIAVELVRTIVGSMGILLAVPATSAIATALAGPPVGVRQVAMAHEGAVPSGQAQAAEASEQAHGEEHDAVLTEVEGD
jgi:uncharacterized membrane protein